MFGSNSSKYSLELMKRDIDEIRNFSVMSLELVQESDKRSVEDEIDKIRSQYHIDHCWIKSSKEILGVVKIIKNTFYGLGLVDSLTDEEVVEIIRIIERDILSFHVFRIECTVRDKYLEAVSHLNYQQEYSRYKMSLDLYETKPDENVLSLFEIKEYKNRYLKDITYLFIDAYRESIDEKIGMFSERIAHSAMNSIMKGSFGIMRPDLSGIIFDQNEMVGAVLVTILEECPFVVIIGVKREHQGKKIGIALMNYVIKKSKSENFEQLKLWVTTENTKAYELYKFLGFKEILSIHAMVKEFQ